MSEKRDFLQSKPTPLFPIDGDESLFPDTAVSPTDFTGVMPAPMSAPGAQALTGL